MGGSQVRVIEVDVCLLLVSDLTISSEYSGGSTLLTTASSDISPTSPAALIA